MELLWLRFVMGIMVGALTLPQICSAEAPDAENAGDRVACSNERYEDFMRLQFERDRAATDRQRYADEIKVTRAENAKRVEDARRLYKRDAKNDDSRAEAEWLFEQKAFKVAQEEVRRQFVKSRDQFARTRCQGLQVPELKEYELENY
mgnify:CR=1 FL=1